MRLVIHSIGGLHASSKTACPGPCGGVIEVHDRILALASYLESIQQ